MLEMKHFQRCFDMVPGELIIIAAFYGSDRRGFNALASPCKTRISFAMVTRCVFKKQMSLLVCVGLWAFARQDTVKVFAEVKDPHGQVGMNVLSAIWQAMLFAE